MLGFIAATKYFKTSEGLQIVLDDATFLIEKNQRVGILGQSGSGKSTAVRLLSGIQELNSGEIVREGTTSWPLGYSGMFHPMLTADSNIKIIAQLCGLNALELSVFCQDFAELLDSEFYAQMNTYSASMRAKLGFALSMAVESDYYLADEVIGIGDHEFRTKCRLALELRLRNSGLIFFSRNPRLTKDLCTHHGVLREGKIIMCDTHEEANHLFKYERVNQT